MPTKKAVKSAPSSAPKDYTKLVGLLREILHERKHGHQETLYRKIDEAEKLVGKVS